MEILKGLLRKPRKLCKKADPIDTKKGIHDNIENDPNKHGIKCGYTKIDI